MQSSSVNDALAKKGATPLGRVDFEVAWNLREFRIEYTTWGDKIMGGITIRPQSGTGLVRYFSRFLDFKRWLKSQLER